MAKQAGLCVMGCGAVRAQVLLAQRNQSPDLGEEARAVLHLCSRHTEPSPALQKGLSSLQQEEALLWSAHFLCSPRGWTAARDRGTGFQEQVEALDHTERLCMDLGGEQCPHQMQN